MADRQRSSKRATKARTVDAVRRLAFDVLVAVQARDAYANLVLPEQLRLRAISGRDAAFATELVYGTLRARGFLDAVIAVNADRPLTDIDPRVLQLLRLGAYQLLRTKVPAHAAVDTTVGVARVAVTEGPARFVNAVLRRIAEHDAQSWQARVVPSRDVDVVRHLAVLHSHPEWIVRAFHDALGGKIGDPEFLETEAALRANNEPPRVQLAARPGLIGQGELAAAVSGHIGRYSPYAVYLPGGDPGKLQPLIENKAQVQDEGSQLVALALASVDLAGRDERWLDLCAGPGGKAALLASLLARKAGGGTLTAVEIAQHRAELVRRAIPGLPVTVLHADGRTVGEQPTLPAGGFDRVLVDAPCTGLGSLRRRAEARWRRQPEDIPALTRLQRELLAAAVRAARPGGLVAYTTCSPHLAETRVIVADALRRLPVTALDARPFFPGVPNLGDGPTVQLWPHRHGTDAMFLVLFTVA